MTAIKELVQWQKRLGDPITIGDITVTPQSQALIIQWPFGGWVWNRPVAILLEQDGETKHIPIIDITRLMQIGLLLIGGVLLFKYHQFSQESSWS